MPENEDGPQDEFEGESEGGPPTGSNFRIMPATPGNSSAASNFDEVLFALADALRSKRSREAIATLIERYGQEMPVAAKRKHRAMLWSYFFTIVVVVAVGALGYLKIITNETAGT